MLLASNKDVALFDVRSAEQFRADSGAKRLAADEVIANPALIHADRDSIIHCTCPSDETSRAVRHGPLNEAIKVGFP